jgi:hypothetical protein
LDVDAERRPKWQDILDNLSELPTKMINGKKVFCMSEDEPILHGVSDGYFYGEGICAVWPIIPGGQIDLGSSSDLLEISYNTLNEVKSWRSYNGIPTVYPSAVRVGYPNILSIFSEVLQKDMTPNFYVHQGGGGIEICGATLAVNEMLLQSHEGFLRLFPVWPRELSAKFGKLRAVGAFLVSSELRDGEVKELVVESEKGRSCIVLNPWPGKKLLVFEVTNNEERPVSVQQEGEKFTFETRSGKKYRIQNEA